ncbi:MAG: DEAD/DEAH box helicase family protein, partial [Proteobacteria bacterium]|nr:DEAD/DEAH box helicase family protein [Pseudomonadota bacterium]
MLMRYVGWGAFAQDVFKWDSNISKDGHVWGIYDPKEKAAFEKWRNEIGDKLHPALGGAMTEEEWAAARRSTQNAHYTSRTVIEAMWAMAERLGFTNGTVLEPAAGVGHFLGLAPERYQHWSTQFVGVELDTISGGILQQLYPAANIQVTGFESAKGIPDNSVDLVISNFPFGKIPIYDRRHPDYSGWSVHNYFFARALDVVKPGGLVVAVTSHWTLDAASNYRMREYLAGKGDLVAAVRLPQSAFKENAGTEVTTDILIFRKKDHRAFEGEAFRSVGTVPVAEAGETADVNEYFEKHPEMVLGRHSMSGTMRAGKREYTLLPAKDEDIEDGLSRVTRLLPARIAGRGSVERHVGRVTESMEKARSGNLIIDGDGVAVVNSEGVLEPPEWASNANKVARARDYIGLRETLKTLIRKQQDPAASDREVEDLRKDLARQYGAFVKKHKNLNNSQANGYLSDDVEFPIVQSLENVQEHQEPFKVKSGPYKGQTRFKTVKTFAPADILSKRTARPFIEPDRAESAEDALKLSMVFRGGLDPDYMAALLGREVDEVKAELADKGLAYENPATGLLETPEDYLSGAVKQKLERAKGQAEEDPRFEKNVKALEAVQPEPLGVDQIHFRLGSHWLPPAMIERFLAEFLDVAASVSYVSTEETSSWRIAARTGQRDAKNLTTWGVDGADALSLIEASLNLKFKDVYDYVEDEYGKTRRVKDKEGSLVARQKQREINDEFVKWAKDRSDVATEIETVYNRDYNGSILKQFYIPDVDRYPGASDSVMLRPHQKRAVSRGLQESCILVHPTGSGKTYTFISLAMEMRRIGTATKPLIVVQGSTVAQYAQSFNQIYPSARVLVPSDNQRNAKNRQKLLAQIATGDWDAVVIPHSFFDMLANDPEVEKAYLDERMAEIREAIKEADEEGDNEHTVKELEALLERKQTRYKKLLDTPRDKSIWWEDLGVDALLVDESHSYKRGEFLTKMGNVKGIDQGTAGKSIRCMLKCL